ncbi:unnamed protein product [Blepharisma stoltei]|uniref:DNA-directed RNA polymerases I, II, and III subunit RPABC1 n=1 Tax=Blepharisma stoltei TaxID=1481888 RepID=A0AAU9K660_9CILI|nr:unnamed protein product [Blepharisma stoltei]
MEAEEANKLYRIWRTLMQMLQDREYHVPNDQANYTLAAFKDKYCESKTREALNFQFSKVDDDNKKIFVCFPDDQRIAVPIIASVAQRMHKEGFERAIIIGKGIITPSAKTAIVELQNHFIIEYFEEKELLVNITEHELVPKHIVMTSEEKGALLKRYRVKESQLPKIQTTDPVARYLGLQRGQVVKIIRNSETAGKYITYRLAV